MSPIRLWTERATSREAPTHDGAGVGTWHETYMPTLLRDVRSRGQSGKHLLALSFSAFDPKRTWEDQEIDGRVLLFRRNPQGRKISSDNRISGESARALANVNADPKKERQAQDDAGHDRESANDCERLKVQNVYNVTLNRPLQCVGCSSELCLIVAAARTAIPCCIRARTFPEEPCILLGIRDEMAVSPSEGLPGLRRMIRGRQAR
jgi:hypothetical protein